MDSLTRTWILTLSKFDEPFGPRSHFENFGEPSLVDVKVILLAEADKMGEYPHPHIELETPRVYVCMYTMVMDTSTRRWTFSLSRFGEPFDPQFHFGKFWGNRFWSM